jgi:hypothetical protein
MGVSNHLNVSMLMACGLTVIALDVHKQLRQELFHPVGRVCELILALGNRSLVASYWSLTKGSAVTSGVSGVLA